MYNSIEDWSAAELTTDSVPSPVTGSPISPVFTGFSLSNSASCDDWPSWDKIEQSPESDFFLKSELLDSPDLTSIPVMSPQLNSSMDMASSTALDDVAFGREGINDTRPLFQPPQSLGISHQAQQSMPSSTTSRPSTAQTTNTTSQAMAPASTATQERRYPARSNLKRKSSSSSSTPSSPRSSCSPPPAQRRHTSSSSKEESSSTSATTKTTLGPKKTAHNMIEKRYRTNLNDKIAALRDSVPALRVMVHRLEHPDAGDLGAGGSVDVSIMDEIKAEAGLDGADEDMSGLTPAHKLNKATILSKATEYIAHLEKKNRNLAKENTALRNRVEGFEMLVMSRSGQRGVWN